MLKNRYITAGIASLAIFVILTWVAMKQRGAGRHADPTLLRPVVVARETIPSRKVVVAEMVEVRRVDPRKWDIPQDALTDVSQGVGMLTATEIYPGRPISKGQLMDKSKVGAAARVAPGKRAMSISIANAAAVAGLIRPGDRVDVLGTFTQPNGAPGVTTTLLQGVEVLAVGSTLDEQPLSATNGSNLVTLGLTPQEARWLASASGRSSLQLVLRAVDDEGATADPLPSPPTSVADPPRVARRPAKGVTIHRGRRPAAGSPKIAVKPAGLILPASWTPLVTPIPPRDTPRAQDPPKTTVTPSALAPGSTAASSRNVDLIVGTRRTSVTVPVAAAEGASAPSPAGPAGP